MIERNKEYYNQIISKLYAVIENQEKIIRDLQEKYNNELDENLKLSELWFETKQRIDKAVECIKDFLCTEEYINVDGIAIANNYAEVLEILGGDSNE